jgi:hypothetical protein
LIDFFRSCAIAGSTLLRALEICELLNVTIQLSIDFI